MQDKGDGGAESQRRLFSVQILQKSRETHNNGKSISNSSIIIFFVLFRDIFQYHDLF